MSIASPNNSRVSLATISAIVVCFNEEKNIGECLESLRWCDEIVVVDAFSTDRTLEICRRYTDRVIQRAWAGYRDQKAFAHSQATKDWVILVDSDERVTPELRSEIDDALARDGGRYAGYAVPRLVFFLKRWWRRGGWYPDYDVRLFRRDRATWGGFDPHEKIIVDGKIAPAKLSAASFLLPQHRRPFGANQPFYNGLVAANLKRPKKRCVCPMRCCAQPFVFFVFMFSSEAFSKASPDFMLR